MIGVKLDKNKKIKTYSTGSTEDLIDFLTAGNPVLRDRFRQFHMYMLTSTSDEIAKKLGIEAGNRMYFANLETVENLGLYIDGTGKISVNKPKVDVSKKEYVSYDITRGEKAFEFGNKTTTYNSTEGLKYTFGVEIETSSGMLSPKLAFNSNLNVSCIRDGSIAGGEYVSGVLVGDAGMIQMHNMLGLLRKNCAINKTCGIHVHIGTANFNKAFTVYAYILGLRLEKEVFETLPKSRTDNEYCDYLHKLPVAKEKELIKLIKKHGFKAGVDMCYDIIYKGMSYGDLPDEQHNKLSRHKHGRYCGKYANVPIDHNFRYKWLNLIPANFNMKKANSLQDAKKKCTIEFRNHSASLSYLKIRNWVLFCMAFVNFVENNKEDIINLNLDLDLDHVFSKVYKVKTARKLSKYFTERKRIFAEPKAEKEEYLKSDEQIIKKRKDICVL